MKKWLFIFAHMDDECSSYGLIQKLLANNNEVNILTICGKGRQYEDSSLRIKAWENVCKNISNAIRWEDCYDLNLTQNDIKYVVNHYITIFKPNYIVTHSPYDNHFEHRMVAQEVLVACRMKEGSCVKQLWQTCLPTNMQTYNQYGVFQPNTFIDITEYIDKKREALQMYVDAKEIPYDNNDIRSLESIIIQNRIYGFQSNVKYAEAYQQIFSVI